MKQFDELRKGPMTSLQWETLWERALTERGNCGLAINPTEAFIKYKQKVGKNWSAIIEGSLAMRPEDPANPDSKSTLRTPQTWQEAHAVLKEEEAVLLIRGALGVDVIGRGRIFEVAYDVHLERHGLGLAGGPFEIWFDDRLTVGSNLVDAQEM